MNSKSSQAQASGKNSSAKRVPCWHSQALELNLLSRRARHGMELSMDTRESRRFVVQGRVQGVGFRAATQRQALALDLLGHAINMPDGSVEVLACGSASALDQLALWLQRGPVLAQVKAVSSKRIPAISAQDFSIG
jgi:acylphosphatase